MISILTLLMMVLLVVQSQQRQQEHDPQFLIGLEPGNNDTNMIISYKTPQLSSFRNRTQHTYTILSFDEGISITTGPIPMFNLTLENATDEIKTFVINNDFPFNHMHVICVQTTIGQNNGMTILVNKDGVECAVNRTTLNGTVLVPPKVIVGPMTGDVREGFRVTLHVPVELPYFVRRMDARLEGRFTTGLNFAQNDTHQQVTFIFNNVTGLNQPTYELCVWTDFIGPLIKYTPWVFDQCFSLKLSPSLDSSSV